jgi:hypothetical protein
MATPCDAYPQHFRVLLMKQKKATEHTFDEVYFPSTRTLHAKYIPYERRASGEEFKALWSRDYTFAARNVLGVTCNPDGDDIPSVSEGMEKWYRIKVPINKKIRYATGSTEESDGWQHCLYINQINLDTQDSLDTSRNKLLMQILQAKVHFTDV